METLPDQQNVTSIHSQSAALITHGVAVTMGNVLDCSTVSWNCAQAVRRYDCRKKSEQKVPWTLENQYK